MRFAFYLLAACFATSAAAETAKTAEDARKELNSTMTAIKQSDERQKELAKKTEALQEELKNLQEEMATMGKDTMHEEDALSSSEDKLSILEEQKKEKTVALDARQKELSDVIAAMVKLRELPPEAVIAMPGKLDETLSTARALGIVTKSIEEEAQSIKLQLHELDELEDQIRHSRKTIATRKMSLSERQADLAAKIKERNALVDALGGQEREEKERVAQLTAKSETLQALVDSLKKSESDWSLRKQESAGASKHQEKSGHALRSFEDAQGKISLPAAGKIVSHFGNPEASATFAKGIVIETRASAGVVAPFDGEVVFAGPFRDYGRMVIIRHSGDYHTLLSGMEEIDCKPGQYLIEGEPIGSMGSQEKGKLYMELREDGRPVDPSDWVKG